MALIDRRIGLLFALFLSPRLRRRCARRLGTVKGGSLQPRRQPSRSRQQRPGPRGTIIDRHGVELAVSEPADDVSATPYLVKDPVKPRREQLAPLLDEPEDELLKQARAQGHRLRLPRPQAARRPGPGRRRRSARRHRPDADARAQLPARLARLAGARRRRHRRQGPVGPRVRATTARCTAPTASAASSRTRSAPPIDVQDVKPAVPGATRRADARRHDPGQGRGGARAGRRDVPAQGRHRDRHGPAQRRGARAGQLAARRRQRPRRPPAYAQQNRAVGYTYEPGSTFKAFTVAGALEDGRSRRHDVRPAADDPGRRPHDRRGPRARPGHADHRARSSPSPRTSARSRSAMKVGADALRPLGAALRLRQAHRRRTCPARSAASSCRARSTRAPRWATCRSARASRSRRCRSPPPTRRSPTAASCAPARRAPRRRPARPRLGAARRVISPQTSRSCARCSRASSRRAARRREVTIPGYKLAGKTGTANKVDPTTGEYSKSRYVASFVGFAPARRPKLLIVGRWSTSPRARSTAARSPRRRSSRSWPSPCRTCGSRRAEPSARPEAAGDHLGSRRAAAGLIGDGPPVEIVRAWPTTSARSRRARCSSACAASRATATTSRPTRSRAAPPRWSSTARSGSACPRWSSRRPRRDGARRPRASTATRPRELQIVGITGTNGKTTTAFLSARCSRRPGARPACSARSTVVVGGDERPTVRTTPEAIDLQAHVRADARRRRRAPARWRSPPTRWSCTAPTRSTGPSRSFTNLTQDHLDFHADMEDYFLAKRRLFEAGAGPRGRQRRRRLRARAWPPSSRDAMTVGIDARTPTARRRDVAGRRSAARRSPSTGRALRVAAARAASTSLNALVRDRGRPRARRRRRRRSPPRCRRPGGCPGASSPSTRGRTSRCSSTTPTRPDSLENVLRAARELTSGRVLVRLRRRRRPRPRQAPADGRGRRRAGRRGDRHLRQPALRGPRGDHRRDPRPACDGARARRSLDRRAAIARAVGLAARGDVVVIAGKGHEQGQEFAGGEQGPVRRRRRRPGGAPCAAGRLSRSPQAAGARLVAPSPRDARRAGAGDDRLARRRAGRPVRRAARRARRRRRASPPQALDAGRVGRARRRPRTPTRRAARRRRACSPPTTRCAALQRLATALAPRAGRAGRSASPARPARPRRRTSSPRCCAQRRRTVATRAEPQHRDRPAADGPRRARRHRGPGARDGRCAARARSPSWPRSPSPTSA